MIRQEELTAEAPVEENETPKPPAENVVSEGSPRNVDCEADSPGYTPYSPAYVPNGPLVKRSEREAIRANSGRQIEVLVMASTDPVDEEARLTDPVDEEARLRAALYDGNNELAKREIYDAHGKSQDARCHIRRAMQLVNYVLAPEDDTLAAGGRRNLANWKQMAK
ncbi:hypothetical protein R1sor_004797 [Riccia sorocarpa]|uniref:Uncharacterized protein n=1 Tax=Riccia sorocarpa TaxID=122646 RepID=A0ABD3HJX4_9MARC